MTSKGKSFIYFKSFVIDCFFGGNKLLEKDLMFGVGKSFAIFPLGKRLQFFELGESLAIL